MATTNNQNSITIKKIKGSENGLVRIEGFDIEFLKIVASYEPSALELTDENGNHIYGIYIDVTSEALSDEALEVNLTSFEGGLVTLPVCSNGDNDAVIIRAKKYLNQIYANVKKVAEEYNAAKSAIEEI